MIKIFTTKAFIEQGGYSQIPALPEKTIKNLYRIALFKNRNTVREVSPIMTGHVDCIDFSGQCQMYNDL